MLLYFEDQLLQSRLVDYGGEGDQLIERAHRVNELVAAWSKQEDLAFANTFFGFVVNTAHPLKLPLILKHNKFIIETFLLFDILILFIGV